MKKLLYGAAYYDEYMPYDRLQQDVAMMKKAGINTVRIAESTWSTCEPQEGVFDFSHVERVMDAMEEAGINVIIGTPTYAIPTWMVKSHPDVMAETVKGRGIYGARQIMDITHPVYRFYAERVIRKLMERRGDGFYPQNAIFQDLVLLCIVWQGIDWLREKKFAKGIGAIAAVLCWPYVVVVFLLLFPGVQEMPIASTIVAFVITSPLPMWTTITDGGWSFLLGGVLLYALRGHRRVQLTAWAVLIFLCDFVPTFGMFCRQADFVWTQMFTDYYEWFGVAAVLLMLLYNGQRGSGHKRLFYWFYPAHVYLLYGASCLVYNVLR